MRNALFVLTLATFLLALGGCAQTRGVVNSGKQQVSRLTGCFNSCQPAPAACAPATEPCVCYSEPVYSSCCGGDNGIGRGGTGAFKVP
jgi:hypothetical protein